MPFLLKATGGLATLVHPNHVACYAHGDDKSHSLTLTKGQPTSVGICYRQIFTHLRLPATPSCLGIYTN